MKSAPLIDVAKIFGISLDRTVRYRRKGNKGIIEVELSPPEAEQDGVKADPFSNILSMAEDVGIRDWSVNHDHYLYGADKR